MPISSHIPGMKSGATKRNIVVAVLYLLVLPLIIVLTPFYLLFAVGTNRNGLADLLSESPLGTIPTIKRGGWRSAFTVFILTMALIMAFGAILPESDNGQTGDNDLAVTSPTPTAESTPREAEDTATTESPPDGTDESGIRQIFSDTHGTSGLATGASQSGNTILFGFGDGDLMVYDANRDGEIISLGISGSVSHIQISEDADTATVAWMDDDLYGLIGLTEEDGPVVRHPGLWDVDTAADGTTIVSVSYPSEGSGSVGLSSNGEVQWETGLNDAVGEMVATSANGEYVVVGAVRYFGSSGDLRGTPGVRLYDRDGVEQWAYVTDEGVISVGIDADREHVVAGTDDGKTIVLDFDGNVVWETNEFGGWVFLSGDGSTIVTSEFDGTVRAVEVETGNELWSADIGTWASEHVSVSHDGTRVLAADRAAGEVFVIDEGDVIWENAYEVGPADGDISGDGTTWSVIIQNNDERSSQVEIYRG